MLRVLPECNLVRGDASMMFEVRNGFVELKRHIGTDATIAEDAGEATKVTDEDVEKAIRRRSVRGVIRYMMQHGHMSPFEHAFMTFEMQMPNHVLTHWLRHHTGSFSVMSRRHGKKLDTTYYLPEYEPEDAYIAQDAHIRKSFNLYESLLRANVPNEQAGLHLPLNSQRLVVWSAKLRNIYELLNLRLREDVEAETREYAKAVFKIVQEKFPLTTQAWVEYHLGSVNVSAVSSVEDFYAERAKAVERVTFALS